MTSDETPISTSAPGTPPRPDVPRTYRNGPSEPHCFSDGPGTWVEIVISGPSDKVWTAVTDIDLPARFSEEFQGADWIDAGPALGASFNGRNENSTIGAWELTSWVNRYEEGTLFGWATSDRAKPGAEWWFTLEPTDGGTLLRYDVTIGPGPSGLSTVIELMPDKEARIISGRLRELHTNMQRTVEGIRDLVEA